MLRMTAKESIFRSRMERKGFPVENMEMDRALYLARLSHCEQDHLIELMHRILSIQTRKIEGIGVGLLAVGTSVFPDEYWTGLKKYLKERGDIRYKGVVEKKGEDLDIMICNEWPDGPKRMNAFVGLLRKNSSRLGDHVIFEDEKRKNGVRYLNVPEEFQEGEGGSVLRMKPFVHIGDSFRIKFNGSRVFHLIFEYILPMDKKLYIERVYEGDNPFSILFRSWDLGDLELAVAWGRKTGKYDNFTPKVTDFSKTLNLVAKLRENK